MLAFLFVSWFLFDSSKRSRKDCPTFRIGWVAVRAISGLCHGPAERMHGRSARWGEGIWRLVKQHKLSWFLSVQSSCSVCVSLENLSSFLWILLLQLAVAFRRNMRQSIWRSAPHSSSSACEVNTQRGRERKNGCPFREASRVTFPLRIRQTPDITALRCKVSIWAPVAVYEGWPWSHLCPFWIG